MAPKYSPELIRFGAFEVDFRARELRKQGRRIKLQDLPFQFLTVLLECPGQVVTRDEMARRLWSGRAFIDVDNGLNTAAKKLRMALGDDAGTPRFIETLPRRGYRFLGPVEHLAAVAPPAGNVQASPTPPVVRVLPETAAPLAESAPAPVPPAAPRVARAWWLAVPGVILLGLLLLRPSMPSRPPGALRTVQLTHSGRVEPFNAILTDGSRLYFDVRFGGQWSLAQVSVEGGTPSPIGIPPGLPELLAISPNHSELLVKIAAGNNEEEAPLWIVPTVAGSPRRLGDVLAHAATWSRDGRGIVYGFGRALYRMHGDGTDSHKLADTPGPPYFISGSPAGQPGLLRFTIFGAASSVWECASDGSGMRRYEPSSKLRTASLSQVGGGWTTDGKYYLFESVNDRGGGFWALREDRSLFHPFDRSPFKIYDTPNDAGQFVPSVDGKRLFFAAGQERRELVGYDSKRSQFLPFMSGAAVRGVAFSKDDRWVAYESIPEATLWRSRADGSERLQLTAPPLRISEPRWSPDGLRIALGGGQRGLGDFHVYVVPSSGGSAEMVPTEPYSAGSPSWSPDGRSLMVSCWKTGARLEMAAAICLVDWKTRQNTVLPGSSGLLRPVWSPDGRYVAALRDSGTQIVLYDMATHLWSAIAGAPAFGIPFWTRDSRYFYFQQALGDPEQPIFRANVATRAVERTMSSKQIPQSGFSGYTLTGLTPNDAPIATVLRSNGDLYALDMDLP